MAKSHCLRSENKEKFAIMFNKTSYRRGMIEGVILFTLGRLGSLITPTIFPDWLYVAVPLLFLVMQFLLAPVWATRRIESLSWPYVSARPLIPSTIAGLSRSRSA